MLGASGVFTKTQDGTTNSMLQNPVGGVILMPTTTFANMVVVKQDLEML